MNRKTAFACAFLAGIAATSVVAAPPQPPNRAAEIARLLQTWQSRILVNGLPVDDARNWSLRNMAKFGRLSDERLALAQGAATLEELELALVQAPVATGGRLDVLMANRPGDIAVAGALRTAKSSPATSPSAYAGLVFTALTPCRIMDTRPSQGGAGAWAMGSSNTVKIGPYPTAGGGYQTGPGAQGGSSTSCGLDTLAGPGQVAVIMAAVSTVSQAAAGYLTFYPQGAPNPGSASVSQWFQPGYVQTSFVLIPTDLVGTVAASGYTSAATDVIIDVVGYFAADADTVDPTQFIGNQTLVQSGANFNISGSGTIGADANIGGALSVAGAASANRLNPNFDSGWFYVTSASGDILVPHGLGVLPSQLVLQQCGALTPNPGSPPTIAAPSFASCATRVGIVTSTGYQDGSSFVNPLQLTASGTNVLIPINSGWFVWAYWTNSGGWGCPGDLDSNCFTGYYRVLAWR